MATKASVVYPSILVISVFISNDFSISTKNLPKESSPPWPKKYASPPSLQTAAETFAGAPPAFFSKLTPLLSPVPISLPIKSINNSPIQNTLFIVSHLFHFIIF